MGDRIEWAFCWLCYRLYLVLPIRWRISSAILPHAGSYAYQTFEQFAALRKSQGER